MTTTAASSTIASEFGLKYPILLAGMGSVGRATPPELVAAVSEAGGMGFLGCSWLDADEVSRRIKRVRELTDKPFGVNFLLPATMAEAVPSREEMRRRLREEYPEHVAFVDELKKRFNLPDVVPTTGVMSAEFIKRQVDVALEERVPAIAAGLGDPAWVVPLARERGVKVLGLAGSVRNARRQVAAGVDFIVAQGYEAGGHTGKIANFALIPQVVDAVSPTPVLAAGGIADGRGIVAALALGAVGVWCGTAFLMSEESRVYDQHKEAIASAEIEDFVITRAYTGKTARDVKNEVIEAWEKAPLQPLPMPLQGVLMDDLIYAAEEAQQYELINNPAGQIGGMLREVRPAKDIMADMVSSARATFERVGQLGASFQG